MKEKILILDFGSQYTQLIARRVREFNTYCEIIPYNKEFELEPSVKAIILSGSPFSVRQSDALRLDLKRFLGKLPVLAVCYGAQLIAQELGGEVSPSSTREYGKVELLPNTSDTIFEGVSASSQVWMSHSDTISRIPDGFEILATTRSIPVAAYRSKTGVFEHPVYAFQFHPEVTHSLEGLTMLQNFVNNIAGCQGQWSAASFIEETIENIKKTVGNEKVMMALSGGVDSTVAAELLHKAIGDRLFCFFVDNGLLRKNEFQEVLDSYRSMGLNIEGVDAKQEFLTELKGLTDPEAKRKAIGRVFIEIFEREAASHKDIHWLGQGTIYPDVIESVSVHGPSVTIKSHHNVGGLPEKMGFKVIEPLRYLFKDEVRRIGKALNIPEIILNRHPFPGPGLGIRILGDITEEKIAVLQEADAIYIQKLKESGWYSKVWQAGTILLPIHSVGVMGDERTYERVVALRAVSSVDGMTAEWSPLPHSLLAEISSDIINKVKGVNRVVYDISTKPPSTIEWE